MRKNRFPENEENKSNVYGGLLGSYEYDREKSKRIKKEERSKSPVKFPKKLAAGLAVSVCIGSFAFFSFLSSSYRSDPDIPAETETEEYKEPEKLPEKTDMAFPSALMCIARMGFYGESVDKADAEKFKIPCGMKVGVLSASARSAGILEGDIVVRINGNAVSTAHDIVSIVREMPAGGNINVILFRSGEYIQYSMMLN